MTKNPILVRKSKQSQYRDKTNSAITVEETNLYVTAKFRYETHNEDYTFRKYLGDLKIFLRYFLVYTRQAILAIIITGC